MMADGVFYLYADLVCSVVMMVCGICLLTDSRLLRLLRVCYAFIMAGALVNTLGIAADLVGYRDISYGNVWPGEVIVNVGVALVMGFRVWRSTH